MIAYSEVIIKNNAVQTLTFKINHYFCNIDRNHNC